MDIQDDRSNLLIFSGNANKKLANDICHELGVRPGKALVSKFSDGEVQVEIEENVRRQEVFVLQPTCAPSAEHLVELAGPAARFDKQRDVQNDQCAGCVLGLLHAQCSGLSDQWVDDGFEALLGAGVLKHEIAHRDAKAAAKLRKFPNRLEALARGLADAPGA